MNLEEMGFEYVDWIHVTQDRVQILTLLFVQNSENGAT
jgi:hypothetical protein